MSANHFPGAPEHGVLKGRAQRSARSKEACWSRRYLCVSAIKITRHFVLTVSDAGL